MLLGWDDGVLASHNNVHSEAVPDVHGGVREKPWLAPRSRRPSGLELLAFYMCSIPGGLEPEGGEVRDSEVRGGRNTLKCKIVQSDHKSIL